MKSTSKSSTKTSSFLKAPRALNNNVSAPFADLPEDETMNPGQVRFFRDLLLEQRSEILNNTDAFKAESAVESTGQGDEGDLAVSEVTLSLSLRLQERQTQLLQKIDRALAKIDDGSFGLCEQCDESLNVKRLKARPVATLCIACKEEQESKERVFA